MVNRRLVRRIEKIILFAFLFLAAAYMAYSSYSNNRAKQITLKSRYTFAVTINSDGEVVQQDESGALNHTLSQDFAGLDIGQISTIWTREFLSQYSQRYLSWSKRLNRIQIEEPEILDDSNDIVLVSFSALLNDTTTDNFEEWDGILDDGRMYCEWVIEYIIDNHYDGTATIYASSIMSTEEYGIEQSQDAITSGTIEDATESSYAYYQIKNDFLSVTYDGGSKFINVPVDISKLPVSEGASSGTQTLTKGSYVVSTSITAFLYGGTASGTSKTPLTVVYSTDLGNSWTTCEVDDETGVQYYYIEYFDVENACIVAEFDSTSAGVYSNVYVTSDGGSTWSVSGQGPSTEKLKGVKFISISVGFFAYEYDAVVDSNLYVTYDGGKMCEKIYLPEQTLESVFAEASGTGVAWSSVFCEASVPVVDKNDDIIVYLIQGGNVVYENGRMAAKYISTDRGLTFKYSGLAEVTVE